MFILDSIGFGSAFALLIPLSYTPDVAFEISGAWFAAPSVIIIFYFLNIFGQFISSSNRKKEEDSKLDVIKWGILERLGFVLIYLSLNYFLDSSFILAIFLITYGIFVYSSGAILPAYFDLVSRVLYKHRAIFFAANLTTGSLAGFLVSRYVDFRIQERGLVQGFSDGLLVVIAITSLSLIPLILIREPKGINKNKEKLNVVIIKNKLKDWYEIYKNSVDVRAIALSNIVSVVPESITPFFTIWLISYYQVDASKIGIWVTLLLISQSLGSFIVPILASRLGFKTTYIFGLFFHFIASTLFILDPLIFQNIIFIFAGLGSGTFVTSQSNISVEIGKVGDAGNTNAMLTAFRLPGLILGPFIFAYFVNLGNIIFFLFVSLISSLLGISIMQYRMKNKIFPQVRFWSKDS
jgi:MFS family permease